MDREARVQFLQDEELERAHLVRDHVTRLEGLEARYGLNLDLLTDIHGTSLLLPDERSSALASRWGELLAVLADNSDKGVWVLQPYSRLVDGCYGFGAKPEYTHHTLITFIRGGGLGDIVYQPKDEPIPAEIYLPGVESFRCTTQWDVKTKTTLQDRVTLAKGVNYGNGLQWFDTSPDSTGIMTYDPESTRIYPHRPDIRWAELIEHSDEDHALFGVLQNLLEGKLP